MKLEEGMTQNGKVFLLFCLGAVVMAHCTDAVGNFGASWCLSPDPYPNQTVAWRVMGSQLDRPGSSGVDQHQNAGSALPVASETWNGPALAWEALVDATDGPSHTGVVCRVAAWSAVWQRGNVLPPWTSVLASHAPH